MKANTAATGLVIDLNIARRSINVEWLVGAGMRFHSKNVTACESELIASLPARTSRDDTGVRMSLARRRCSDIICWLAART